MQFGIKKKTSEPPHDKSNKITVRPASAQSDQSLHCLHEESLGPQLLTERRAKTLIRLGKCQG